MSRFPMRAGEPVQSATSEGWTVYEPESDSLHVLNDSAKAIWDLSDGETSPTEMAQAIAELTQVDFERALSDVESTLNSLRDLGLASV